MCLALKYHTLIENKIKANLLANTTMEVYKKVNFWGYILRLINVQDYKLSNKQENIELVAYSLMAFMIPFIFKHPQILVGALVNMVLILAALNLRGKNILPVILLPSLGALAGGFLFGSLTFYLIYLIPFIWIGNTALVLAFKYLKLKNNQNFFLTLGFGSAAKTGFLFGVTFLLVSLSIVPNVFLVAMGAVQILTVVTGGLLAFTVQEMKS